jgi:catechol 2,3-dioxygenase-like lactoylglutathione lyase family enzyme
VTGTPNQPADDTTKETTVPEFSGITRVAVTVTDLARSTAWYPELFGSPSVLDEEVDAGAFHHTVFALGGGHLFGLHKHAETNAATFDERSGLTRPRPRSAAATVQSSRSGAADWTSSGRPRRDRRCPTGQD